MEKIDGRSGALKRLARDARQTSALAADSHVEAFISLFSKFCDGDIFAHLYATADVHTYLAHDVDFRLDDVLLEFV